MHPFLIDDKLVKKIKVPLSDCNIKNKCIHREMCVHTTVGILFMQFFQNMALHPNSAVACLLDTQITMDTIHFVGTTEAGIFPPYTMIPLHKVSIE